MTLQEIGYLVLETIREGNIVDDERLDMRLIYQWIHSKRAQFMKRARSTNPNNRLNHNLYQTFTTDVTITDVTAAGNYPYADATTQSYKIVISDKTIPPILEDKSGPVILSIESEDLMKLPFSIVSFDQMKVAGNGRFNSSIIFTSYRDNKLYFTDNDFFDTYDTVIIRAIFEDPTDVGDFTETSEYPITQDLVEDIKNAVYDIDAKVFMGSNSDEVNDASGDI